MQISYYDFRWRNFGGNLLGKIFLGKFCGWKMFGEQFSMGSFGWGTFCGKIFWGNFSEEIPHLNPIIAMFS